MKKLKKILYIILVSIFSITFLVSGFMVARYFIDSKQQSDKYNNLANQVQEALDNTDAPEVTIPTPDSDSDSATVLRQYAQLYLQNPDMVGWIKIDGTKINYPVMQTPYEKDYYLYRNFEKEENAHGCIYIDEHCDMNKPSDNITVYGHHMKDGSMFAALADYQDREFWEEHKTIHFDTLTQQHTYEVFAVFTTTASVGKGFPYHQFVNAADPAEFDDFVATCKALSLIDTGITPEYGDKLICLSTCEYTQVNGRFVVAARRID